MLIKALLSVISVIQYLQKLQNNKNIHVHICPSIVLYISYVQYCKWYIQYYVVI
jgi:hypothetical protein